MTRSMTRDHWFVVFLIWRALWVVALVAGPLLFRDDWRRWAVAIARC